MKTIVLALVLFIPGAVLAAPGMEEKSEKVAEAAPLVGATPAVSENLCFLQARDGFELTPLVRQTFCPDNEATPISIEMYQGWPLEDGD